MTSAKPLILLTGATGYIGGRLLTALEQEGLRVRALARHPENVERQDGSQVEVVAGDLLDLKSLRQALDGVDVAFYLVHSMAASSEFQQRDRDAALNFAAAAREAGVGRI